MAKNFREKMLINVDLKNFCSFKIGGKGRYLIEVESINDIINAISFSNLESIPFYCIGNGTNILFSSKDIEAIFLVFKNKFSQITNLGEIEENNIKYNLIKTQAGTSLGFLCDYNLKKGLSGLEWAIGIPGTVGGAVVMNAGAFQGQMSDSLQNVTVYSVCEKCVKTLEIDKLNFAYRDSIFKAKDFIIIEATMKFKILTTNEVKELQEKYMEKRKKTQSISFPNAGSVFKRSKNIIPAKIIEDLNLKGLRVGNAEVSKIHSGFIVNLGNATSSDVEELIEKIRENVWKNCGIMLQLEIIKIGG